MESSRKQRWKQLQSVFEPGFRRMLMVSLLLHLLLPILYHTSWFPKKEPIKPPVYRVNLVNKIVKKPQAGRPEAVVTKKKPKPKPKPKAKPKPKPVAVKPKPKPVKPKPLPPKPKPVSKPEVKPESKPVPEKPKVSKAQESARLDAMAALKAKLEKQKAAEERKKQLAALRAAVARESAQIESPVVDAPVGMPTGKGDEVGVEAMGFVQEFIQQQWSLSKYQVIGNPEAEVIMLYNQTGELLHYRFIKKSGNSIFDESLVKAINKSKRLPQNLPEEMEFHIVFNLKDMLDRQ